MSRAKLASKTVSATKLGSGVRLMAKPVYHSMQKA